MGISLPIFLRTIDLQRVFLDGAPAWIRRALIAQGRRQSAKNQPITHRAVEI